MGRKYDFFDFQELLSKKNVSVEEFLKNQFNANEKVLEKLESLGIDKTKKTLELSQKEIDKLFRFYDSDFFLHLKETKEEGIEEKREKPKIRRKWYERFYRWFISSDGFLVIMGKNERHNRTILKRYSKENDLLLFANLKNPIFTVIKNEKSSSIPPETIYQAAQFTASYSIAWKEKKEKTTIFYVKRDQVMLNDKILIQGEIKEIKKVKPVISISVKQENGNVKLIFGPPTAIRKISPFLVTIIPGDKEARELSQEIKKELMLKAPFELKDLIEALDAKEIEKVIPFGKGEIVK